jgi:hypothetical protein
MKNGLHIDSDGTKRWYKDDKHHRLDGPAIERVDGIKEWWVDGKRHRTDGPAVEETDGAKSWHKDGEWLDYNDEGFWALWDRLTDEQRNNVNLLMHLPKAGK